MNELGVLMLWQQELYDAWEAVEQSWLETLGEEKVINVLDLDYRSLVLAIFCLKWQLYAIFLTFSLDLSSARENSPWLLGKEESLKPYFWEIVGLYVDSLEKFT